MFSIFNKLSLRQARKAVPVSPEAPSPEIVGAFKVGQGRPGQFIELMRIHYASHANLINRQRLAQYEDGINAALTSRRSRIIVAENVGSGAVAGFALVAGPAFLANTAELALLAVAPMLQKQGLGRRLIRQSEEFASSRGATALSLCVNERNRPAFDLYSQLGYVVRGRAPYGYADDDAHYYMMSKVLPAQSVLK